MLKGLRAFVVFFSGEFRAKSSDGDAILLVAERLRRSEENASQWGRVFPPREGAKMGKSVLRRRFSGVDTPEVQKHALTVLLEGMFRHKKVMYSIVLFCGGDIVMISLAASSKTLSTAHCPCEP